MRRSTQKIASDLFTRAKLLKRTSDRDGDGDEDDRADAREDVFKPFFRLEQSRNQETGGTHVNISGGGITKHAKNPKLAQDFLEWLGTQGQSVLVDSNHEFPASTEATPEPLITEEFGLDFERQPLQACAASTATVMKAL